MQTPGMDFKKNAMKLQQFPRSWYIATGAQCWMMGLFFTHLPRKSHWLPKGHATFASGCMVSVSHPHTPTPFSFISAEMTWGKLCNRLPPWPGACTSRHLTEVRVGEYLSSHFCTETERSQLLLHTRSLENIYFLLPISYLEGDSAASNSLR